MVKIIYLKGIFKKKASKMGTSFSYWIRTHLKMQVPFQMPEELLPRRGW
jgi:hypothetical protein